MTYYDKNGVELKEGLYVIAPSGFVGRITGCFEDCAKFFIIYCSYSDRAEKWHCQSLEVIDDELALLKILEQSTNAKGYLSYQLPQKTGWRSARVQMGRFFNGWWRWLRM